MVKVRFGKVIDCDTQLVVGSTTGCWLCFVSILLSYIYVTVHMKRIQLVFQYFIYQYI